MVTVNGNPKPTTKYRCELDMCCLTWYKNLGPPFTGMPIFLGYRGLHPFPRCDDDVMIFMTPIFLFGFTRKVCIPVSAVCVCCAVYCHSDCLVYVYVHVFV